MSYFAIVLIVFIIGPYASLSIDADESHSDKGNAPGGAMDTENRLGEMITIPAGSFLMGNSGNEGYGGPAELPQHSVDLPTYQIGKYEVTRGEYRRFIEAGGYQDPQYWSPQGWEWKESDVIVYAGMYGSVRRVKRPEDAGPRNAPHRWEAEQEWIGHGYGHPRFVQTDYHPVICVTYYEAEAYCKWAGGRLPTEAEWEKAARWDEEKQHARIWPWGDTWDPEKCNNPEDHNPAGGGYRVNQSAPVGSYPEGASPYGCRDMVGNAYEWVYDWHSSYPGGSLTDPVGPVASRVRVIRGGSWFNFAAVCRAASRFSLGPGYRINYLGFRLCRSQ